MAENYMRLYKEENNPETIDIRIERLVSERRIKEAQDLYIEEQLRKREELIRL